MPCQQPPPSSRHLHGDTEASPHILTTGDNEAHKQCLIFRKPSRGQHAAGVSHSHRSARDASDACIMYKKRAEYVAGSLYWFPIEAYHMLRVPHRDTIAPCVQPSDGVAFRPVIAELFVKKGIYGVLT
jgi:hypothetical protein